MLSIAKYSPQPRDTALIRLIYLVAEGIEVGQADARAWPRYWTGAYSSEYSHAFQCKPDQRSNLNLPPALVGRLQVLVNDSYLASRRMTNQKSLAKFGILK
jgi:hypothetical protein